MTHAERAERNHPSPLLREDEVRHLLIEGNAAAGAAGGAIGGAMGGGAPGAVGGAQGGRTGGRIGARLFTKVMGLTCVLPVPRTEETVSRARALLGHSLLAEQPGSATAPATLIGMIGSGALGMNGAVLQLVWHPDRLQVTAHALEGLIPQRTCERAIERLATELPGP